MKKLLCGALALGLMAGPASAMSYFSSPSATKAAQNAATIAAAINCVVSQGAVVALSVEDALNEGKVGANQVVRTGTTTKVENVSAVLCTQLGGIAQQLNATPAK
jgi:hypothetical protein